MRKLKKKTVELAQEEDVHQFWGAHDFTDYLEDFEAIPEHVTLSPELAKKIRVRSQKKHLVAIRLDEVQYSRVQKIALKKSLALSSLIRTWIAQAIQKEATPA